MRRSRMSVAVCGLLWACGGDPDPGDVPQEDDNDTSDVQPGVKVEPQLPPPGKIVPGPTRYFPREALWNHDISESPVDGDSARIIRGVAAAGGFGSGEMLVDFDLAVLDADAATPMMTFTPNKFFYAPDCDQVPVPVPPDGALEDMPGYVCLATDRDCHLIVHHRPTGKLYEMWRADIRDGLFRGGCLAVWDTTRTYGARGRGFHCTSADAAGFPIAPLLFTADEVAAGAIEHAVRFILPNDRIRSGVYVAPATHSTSAADGGRNSPPFGARFRLRKNFPVERLPTAGARVVARALQRYGMFLADGGTKALTAQNDRFTVAKWGRLLAERDLRLIRVTDFEMISGGPRVPYEDDACEREQP